MDFLSVLNQKKPALIMSLPGNDPSLARIAVECGADVIKIHMNVQHRASGIHFGSFEEEKERLAEIREIAGQLPCGIVAGSCVEDVERDFLYPAQMGYEFISLYASATPLSVLADKNMKKMIALAPGYSLEEVRLLGAIGADVLEASVMRPETYGQRLTAKELLEYAAITENSKLPVVIPTQRAILPCEVSQLSQIGVSGIMIGAVVTGKEMETIKKSVSEFRNAIDKL
ncbi:MAG: hypothetical protein E7322_07695 [Clostridiales bacterium]|nr:hypothetical protein [Clostridiales bacterium]